MSAEYRIHTPMDFMAIPKDRREAMLIDLAEWMKLRDKYAPLVADGLIEIPDEFHWIDDGKTGLSQFNLTVQVDAENEKVTP